MADTGTDSSQSGITNELDIEPHFVKAPLSKWLKISVKEPTRRNTTTKIQLQDSYVVYLLETKVIDKSMIYRGWLDDDDPDAFPEVLTIWRRYSEFDLLRDYVMTTYPSLVVPPLPEKRTTSAWQAAVVDKSDPEFIERRRIGLELFLKRLCELIELSEDKVFLDFLKNEENWKEVVGESNYQTLKDSRLKALSAGYRIKRPNEKFELLRKYATDLETSIGNILRIRAKTAEHLYGIHKIHANYGREFSQWSSIEKPDMAEALQKIGHYIDAFAQDVDIAVESEEDFADQLKEYHGYADSLRQICKKQEVMQLELEQAEDALESKRLERDNFSQGKTGLLGGLKAKMFGAATVEQKEEKLRQLDEQILDMEEKVATLKETKEKFEETASANIDKFHKQKAHDITDILINFIIMSIDRCKKSRSAWANVKEVCDSI